MAALGQAPTLTTLYNFSGADGRAPSTGVILGTDGNLYGTTGPIDSNTGTIFQLTPTGTLTTLYQGATTAPPKPLNAPSALIQASDGNFYGTQQGSASGGGGYGSVFQITPSGTFTPVANELLPESINSAVSALVQGSDGNFYGTTTEGYPLSGSAGGNYGTVFKVTPTGTVTVLYDFTNGSDGSRPSTASLAQDSAGNLYGMTASGAGRPGTVFKVTSGGSLATVYTFSGVCDGVSPANIPGHLLLGADGNLYGTTGATTTPLRNGTIFKLTMSGELTTLYAFAGVDGSAPSGLQQGSDGNFYGATATGGAFGHGSVFKLAPDGSLTTLYSFSGLTDGDSPEGQLALSADLNTIYGTTLNGGSGNLGTAFALSGVTTAAGPASQSAVCLASPTAVMAAAGDGQVMLTWQAATVAQSYNVYVGTSAGAESNSPVQTGITGTTATLVGLIDGTTYYFKVAAVNPGNNIGLSSEVSATPLLAPPAPPNLQTATAGNAQVSLSWSASAGATSYNVYAGTTSGGESTTPVAMNVTTTSTNIAGLANGTTYYFTVAAVNAAGTSATSNEASANPIAISVPTGLTARSGNGQITLTWNAVPGANSYSLYQGTQPGSEAKTPVQTGITAANTTVSGLQNGTEYFFTVVAVNGTVTSDPSNEASAAPLAPPPTVPTGLKATAADSQVSLSWDAVSGATSYAVYMGTAPGGEGASPVQGSITASNTTIPNLANGTTYYFKLTAVGSTGASGQSSEVSATPDVAHAAGASGGGGRIDSGMLILLGILLCFQRSYRLRW